MNWHNQHVFWYRLHNLEILLFHIKKQVRILPEGFYNIGKEFSYITKKDRPQQAVFHHFDSQ